MSKAIEQGELDAVMRHAEQLRRVRNGNLKRAMQALEHAAARVAAANAEGLKALADQQLAESQLAALLERGERKVIHNSLVTVEQDGGLRIERQLHRRAEAQRRRIRCKH